MHHPLYFLLNFPYCQAPVLLLFYKRLNVLSGDIAKITIIVLQHSKEESYCCPTACQGAALAVASELVLQVADSEFLAGEILGDYLR